LLRTLRFGKKQLLTSLRCALDNSPARELVIGRIPATKSIESKLRLFVIVIGYADENTRTVGPVFHWLVSSNSATAHARR